MPLDAITLQALKSDLSAAIVGTKIDRVQQPENDTLILSLRSQGFSGRLLICAGNGSARVHLTNERYENPMQPPMFCMLMRKHVEGGRIVEVSQPPMERLLDIKLDCVDALGDRCEKHLIAELMGRYSNIILTDENYVITDCLRRIGSAMTEGRIVLPGMIYRFPEQQGRKDITECSDSEIFEMADKVSLDTAAEKMMLSSFMGLSPLVCREISFRAYGQTDIRMFEAKAKDGGKALISELIKLREAIKEEEFTPVLLKDSFGMPKDLTFMEIGQYEGAYTDEKLRNFSELLDAYYTRREKAEKARQRSMTLLKNVKTLRDRLSRKIEAQKKELRSTEDRETLRQTGDIIMANIGIIPKGAKTFEADDFFIPKPVGKERYALTRLRVPSRTHRSIIKTIQRRKTPAKFSEPRSSPAKKSLNILKAFWRKRKERKQKRISLKSAANLKTVVI